MNLPILIIGYQRSGTTLLRRLVSMHPGLKFELIHERKELLLNSTNAENAIATMTYPATQKKRTTGSIMSIVSGQKTPYVTFKDAKKIIDKFLNLFPKSYIMHIIREPETVISSQFKTFGRNIDKSIRQYCDSVPRVYEYISSCDNSVTVRYENLVSYPMDVLSSIYIWMGKKVDKNYIKKVISTKEPWDYEGRIMPGLRYFNSIVTKEREILLNQKQKKVLKSNFHFVYQSDF